MAAMRASAGTGKAALRAARWAAASPLADIAAAAGVTQQRLVASLRTTRRDSRCESVAAAVARLPVVASRRVAVSHRVCPPAMRRAAGRDRSETVSDAAHGAAGWSARSQRPGVMHRCQLVASVVGNDRDQRELAARFRGCPPALLRGLRRFGVATSVVVSNPACPPDELARIAMSLASFTHTHVARHESSPLCVLRQLAQQASEPVTREVARNPSSGPAGVRICAGDAQSDIRDLAAQHANCPPDVLDVLATDTEFVVRQSALRNLGCSPAMLARLALDPDTKLFWAAAANPNCPPDALDVLAGRDEVWYRQAAASSRACPAETFAVLAADTHPGVRVSAAQNPNCSTAMLERFATDPDRGVRSQATHTTPPGTQTLWDVSPGRFTTMYAPRWLSIPTPHPKPWNDSLKIRPP